MVNWTQPLDEYCERVAAGFWAEPANAFSNLSFIVAALVVFYDGKRRRVHTPSSYWLTFLLLSIGLGSFCYHTFANVWSRYTDIVPIYLFQISTMAIYGRLIGSRLGLTPVLGSIAMLMAFAALVAAFSVFPKTLLNGSISYVPAWLALSLLGVYQAAFSTAERYSLLLASACLALSLALRSLDLALCASVPLGTHFLWHLINGFTLYLVIKAVMGAQGAMKTGG